MHSWTSYDDAIKEEKHCVGRVMITEKFKQSSLVSIGKEEMYQTVKESEQIVTSNNSAPHSRVLESLIASTLQ